MEKKGGGKRAQVHTSLVLLSESDCRPGLGLLVRSESSSPSSESGTEGRRVRRGLSDSAGMSPGRALLFGSGTAGAVLGNGDGKLGEKGT